MSDRDSLPVNCIAIDDWIASLLRGESAAWPVGWTTAAQHSTAVDRILYHGIAGLIADRAPQLTDWPPAVLAPVRAQAIAQAMWELRHKPLLSGLLTALADDGVVALLLKGSALAYDLYPNPATRARGDSDVLVAPADLGQARAVLGRLGFRRLVEDSAVSDELALQEIWSFTDGGTEHHLDLHWQLVNAQALRDVLDFATCADRPLPLPRLGEHALAMNRTVTLAHTCVHRAMHIASPYFVAGAAHYGGDRLIWAKDIDLLARALDDGQWTAFADLAIGQGIAAACLDGMRVAGRGLGTAPPPAILERLAAAPQEPASAYLLDAKPIGRAWRDFAAMPLRSKLGYVRARALPPAAFIRAKYPDRAGQPLALLYLRRMAELVVGRPGQGGR